MSTLDTRYPIGRFLPPKSYDATLRAEHLAQLARQPGDLRAAVAGLSAGQLDTPYRDGGWTVRQVVHHVPDSHVNAYVRHRLTVTEEQPTIRGYDEVAWAATPEVPAGDVEPPLALLDALHRRWLDFLHALPESAWQRTFLHGDTGKVWTLAESLALYAWHGRHHVAQIIALRRRSGW
jgi:uncharacterized damage-inducible protein DinB